MGLDMYLLRLPKEEALVPKDDWLGYEVMYWRKANQIHGWFVDNVQNGKDDCGYYRVTKEQLEDLLDRIDRVLNGEDPEELLPTREGFFFGSYDYDDVYFSELRETKEKLTEILSETDFDNEVLVYTSSW